MTLITSQPVCSPLPSAKDDNDERGCRMLRKFTVIPPNTYSSIHPSPPSCCNTVMMKVPRYGDLPQKSDQACPRSGHQVISNFVYTDTDVSRSPNFHHNDATAPSSASTTIYYPSTKGTTHGGEGTRDRGEDNQGKGLCNASLLLP